MRRSTLVVLQAAFSAVLASCTQPPPPATPEPTTPTVPPDPTPIPSVPKPPPADPTPLLGPDPAASGASEPVPRPGAASSPTIFVEGDPNTRSSAQLCLGNVVPSLRPGRPVDSLEIRTLQKRNQQTEVVVTGRAGSPCGTAKDQAACQRAFEAARPPNHEEIFVYTRGDEVGIVSRTEVPAFLAPIDSPEEAAAVLVYAPPDDRAEVTCDPSTFKATGAGFTSVQEGRGRCERDITTFAVSKAGKARRVSTRHVVDQRPCRMPVKGRRPEGLVEAPIDGADVGSLGAYLAEACMFEAASVTSFRRLERELGALGAPRDLRRRARASALDEARHTRLMRRLARRAGTEPRAPRVARVASRTALAIAIENVVEGCVNETFAALLARYQADHAADAELRAALDTIARDEARHAALAWDVRSWLDERLTEGERAQVREAYEGALTALGDGLDDGLGEDDQRAMGLPSRDGARALARAWQGAAAVLGGAGEVESVRS